MAVAVSSIRTPVVKISCSSSRCSFAQPAWRPSTVPCRHTALTGFAARVGASAAAPRRAAVTVLASTVPLPAAVAAAPATELAPPPAIFQRVVEAGVAKAALPTWKMALLGLLAGFYIGFGALLMLNIGVACPGLAATNPGLQKLVMGLFGLPFGLIMVMICGAELFTGNTMFAAAAAYEGRIPVGQLARIWSVSFVTNLIGSLGLVTAVYFAGALPPLGTSVGLAAKKVALPFHQAFLRAILANWLVNIAIWQGTGATSVPGKIMGGLLPILTFVGIGLEHSVANMFFIPMAMALGADISVKQFLVGNLLPVTLGNIIGGAVCVAGAYSLAFGRAGRAAAA